MAMAKCRECGHDVSTEAEECANCGAVNPAPSTHRTKKIGKWLGGIFVAITFIIAFNVITEDQPSPICQITSKKDDVDIMLVDGEFDFAVKFDITVRNLGDAGTVNLDIILMTSEGDFQRTQSFYLEPNQNRTATIYFHEPSVAAENMSYRAVCSPS